MAFYLPAPIIPHLTGIPFQVGAQEHESVQRWRNLMGDWPVVKL